MLLDKLSKRLIYPTDLVLVIFALSSLLSHHNTILHTIGLADQHCINYISGTNQNSQTDFNVFLITGNSWYTPGYQSVATGSLGDLMRCLVNYFH